MKIGVLGSGDVGRELASGLLKHGHEVAIGSGSPQKLAGWAKENPEGKTGSFADAAAFGELLILAVKGSAAADVLRAAGAANLAGKPIADTCNPIADAPPVNGVLRFFTGHDQSLMEQLQSEFPAGYFVKAFNSVGKDGMVDPHFDGGRPTMFICGNNQEAKKVVGQLIEQLGWETADMGSVEAARAIEPLCMLWCIPGFLRGEWSHAFKLLKK